MVYIIQKEGNSNAQITYILFLIYSNYSNKVKKIKN